MSDVVSKMSIEPHEQQNVKRVSCAVLTVSDTRTQESDVSGTIIRDRLLQAGHTIHNYLIVRDDPKQIRAILIAFRDDPACQVVIMNGGTGIAARDTSFEAVSALLDKRLDGFGEFFRAKSIEAIGPKAMLSRAVAGCMRNTVVFSIPGSASAVSLAIEDLILPVLGHAVYLLQSSK